MSAPLKQVVYLSTRPDELAETQAYVQHWMPWLTDVVVVTPRRLGGAFAGLGCTVLHDEDVLDPGVRPGDLDHQQLNFALRVGMCRSGAVDEVFVCSDDDYRPMKAIEPERFVTAEGRLRGYAFYDLQDWSYDETEFDHGQVNTLQVLSYLGAPQVAYASHMPQAFDRDLFLEAATRVRRVAPTVAVDEWAVHGNLGRLIAPDRYADPEPYVTLAWPGYPNQWRHGAVAREHAFENFYPELYAAGHLFAGLPTAFDPATAEQVAVEKLVRWRRLDLAIRRLDMPDDVVVPWTEGSPVRRAYFKALRPMRKTVDYLLMGDRIGERSSSR